MPLAARIRDEWEKNRQFNARIEGLMNVVDLVCQFPEWHPLAKHFSAGKVFRLPDGKLRIEVPEEAMDELMDQISAAYYGGILEAGQIEVAVAPKPKDEPLTECQLAG